MFTVNDYDLKCVKRKETRNKTLQICVFRCLFFNRAKSSRVLSSQIEPSLIMDVTSYFVLVSDVLKFSRDDL